MNPISNKIQTGTLGELLVQIRLLQGGVQAAPPIKDSGNDLIAVHGQVFRAVSVRTTTTGRFNKPDRERFYHVLAVVDLVGDGLNVYLDQSRIYLIPHQDVANISNVCETLVPFLWSEERMAELFC